MHLSLKSKFALPAVFAAVVLLAAGVSATFSSVRAQSWDYEAQAMAAAAVTNYASFQYATLTGTTNTINATNVPVTVGKTTTYKNLTFQVTVDATGAIKIVSGSPTVVASSITNAAGCKAGTYVAPGNTAGGKGYIVVSGPGVTANGSTVCSMGAAVGADPSTYPTSATWYSGSVTSTANPVYNRLKNAGITSSAWSYGVLGNTGGQNPGGYWYTGSLIGVSQTGNAVTIASFSTDGGNWGYDKSGPVDQITFTFVK